MLPNHIAQRLHEALLKASEEQAAKTAESLSLCKFCGEEIVRNSQFHQWESEEMLGLCLDAPSTGTGVHAPLNEERKMK